MYTSNVSGYTSYMDIFGAGKSGKANGGSDIFDIGTSFKEMLMNKSGMKDMLEGLAERFPDANVTKGKPGAGIEGTEKYFGKEKGDHAAIDENLLAAMSGNSDLMKQVQDAMESFFNSANPQGMEGAYTQRSISISITVVTMNVSRRAEGSGDLLSSQEMQSQLQSQLQGMIERFFGTEAGGEAKGHDKHGEEDGGGAGMGFSGGAFSFEMFYSSTMLSAMNGGRDEEWSRQSGMFGFKASLTDGYQGSFPSLANSMLPESIARFLNQGGGNGSNNGNGNTPFTSMLDSMFGMFGMSMNSFSMGADGAFLSGGEAKGKDMMSDFFDYLLNNSARPEVPEQTAAAEETAKAS